MNLDPRPARPRDRSPVWAALLVSCLPNGNTGDPRTARYTFEPRSFVWTNTFSF